MAPQSELKDDLREALELLKQDKLEEAGHQLKTISIKAYYASKESRISQKWLRLHETMTILGHTFLTEEPDTSRPFCCRAASSILDLCP